MKELRKNIKYLLAAMLACFIVLALYLMYDALIWGNRWLNSPYNPRLQQQRSLVIPGNIYDTTGQLLVGTDEDGNRTYQKNKSQRLGLCHVIGDTRGLCATGVESTYAATLLGYNADFISIMKQFISQTPSRGNDITLTVNEELNTAAYKALDGEAGSVVMVNYKTGEVLVMTNSPGFDPKDPDSIDLSDSSSVLVNRANQGRYVPGSVFKIVTLACALDNGYDSSWSYECSGKLNLEGDVITCPSDHGEQTLEEAFANSCNCAFARLGCELGADRLVRTAQGMGFGKTTSYKDFVLSASTVDINSASDEYEIGWAAIGQHKDTVTPLGMCLIAGGIANNGLVKAPYLVKSTGISMSTLTSALQDKRILSSSTAAELTDMMQAAVEEGTGTRAMIDGVTVCGKTGTAEVGSSVNPHAWFVGFIEEDEYPYAIAVIVENGGSGGKVAAPIAKTVLSKAVKIEKENEERK